jgi:hypothetical protein
VKKRKFLIQQVYNYTYVYFCHLYSPFSNYPVVAATNNNGKKNQSLRTQVLTKDIGNDSINSLRVQTNSRPQITVNGDDNIGDIPNDEETKKFADEYVGFVFSPKAPGYFDLLVEVLEKFRLAGEPQPRRSRVGNELLRRNPLLYHRAGCSSFKEYIELAVAEGIVLIGGDKGLAWVTLNEDIRGKLFD